MRDNAILISFSVEENIERNSTNFFCACDVIFGEWKIVILA